MTLSVVDANLLADTLLVPGRVYGYGLFTGVPSNTGTPECADANYLRQPAVFPAASGTNGGVKASSIAADFAPMAVAPSIAGEGLWDVPQGTLTTALASGTAYTTLAVSALTAAVASGDSLVIGSGATTQTVVASAAAAPGATSVSVTSFVANAAYAIGVTVVDVQPGTAAAVFKIAQPVTSYTAGVGVQVQYASGAITFTVS